jgi:hypothetical protein
MANTKEFVAAVRTSDYHSATQVFNTLMREKLQAALGLERKSTYINEDYNGWKNRETWNVALWIGNDQGLYNMAREYAASDSPYEDFAAALKEMGGKIAEKTPDGVAWNDSGLDIDALDEMMKELISEAAEPQSAFPAGMTKDAKDCETCKKLGHACPRHREVPKLNESACPGCGKPFVGVYRDAGSDAQRNEPRCKSCGATQPKK